jgi:hypothetical protein
MLWVQLCDHCFQLIQWYHVCVCVTVFMFHVTFPTPTSISPTPTFFILYSLCRSNWPADKVQTCFFGFGLMVLWIGQPEVWLLTLCIGLVLTLSGGSLFPHCLCCATLLNAASYQNLCAIYKTHWHFVMPPCTVHDSLTLAIWSIPVRHFLNLACYFSISFSIYDSSCFSITVMRILFVRGNSAMVQLFVHCVTYAVLGEGVKIDVSCFTCP